MKCYLKTEARRYNLGRNQGDNKMEEQAVQAIDRMAVRSPKQYGYPKQKDSYNCGVWVATFIRKVLIEKLTGTMTDWSAVTAAEVEVMRK